MLSDRDREGHPLVDEPQPTAPVDQEFPPPPYSSLFGTQSQAYTPIPPYPMSMSMSMPMPMPEVNPPYRMHDGKAMSQQVYSPTTYDPMCGVEPAVSETARPNQTVNVSSSTERRLKRSCGMQTCSVVAMILLVLVTAACLKAYYKHSQSSKEADRSMMEEMRREQERQRQTNSVFGFHHYDAFPNEFNDPTHKNTEYGQYYNDMFKRTVRGEQPDSNHYGSFDFNDQPQKSHRQRRGVRIKNSFHKKNSGNSRNKGRKRG